MKLYAGIGARDTPDDVMSIMTELAKKFEKFGYVLRSGGADGADKAFAKDVKNKEIYIPWRGFNNITTIYDNPSEKAIEIAENFHPAWHKLGSNGKLLQARNSHIMLGEDCKTPVDFVICWTKTGGIIGGTGQSIRVANYYKIPVYNLKNESDIHKLNRFMSDLIEV